MGKLGYIISDLRESFDGKPWYGDSVMKKLETVDWRCANDQVYSTKSIAVLVQHIVNWRIFVIKKLQGDAAYDIIIDELNDWTQTYVNNEQEWNRLIDELRNTQNELLELLSKCSKALLDEKVPGKKYTFGPILQSISQHDIYHLGQIAMLNAQRKS